MTTAMRLFRLPKTRSDPEWVDVGELTKGNLVVDAWDYVWEVGEDVEKHALRDDKIVVRVSSLSFEVKIGEVNLVTHDSVYELEYVPGSQISRYTPEQIKALVS